MAIGSECGGSGEHAAISETMSRCVGPATVAFQPRPIGLKVMPAGEFTVIGRGWGPGDAARCRLCPKGECNADGGWCLVRAPGAVAPRDAALYARPGAPTARP